MTAFTPNVDLTVIKRLFGAVEQPGGFVVSDVISPVIEIQELSLMQRREVISASSNFSSVNGTVSIPVPPGENWLTHYFASATSVLNADQSITIQMMVSMPGIVPGFRFDRPVDVPADSVAGVGRVFEKPLILPAGSTIGVRAGAIVVGAAGSIGFSVAVQFTRIPL